MMFSSNAFRFVLVLAAAYNAVTSATVTPVDLGTAENYVILAKTGISTVPDSVITGDIGVSPIEAAAMTGFSLIRDAGLEHSTSTQIIGMAFASDYDAATATALTAAVGFMETAYNNAAGRPNTDAARINLGGGTLGGAIGGADDRLTPGVYTFGTDVDIALTIYFDGSATDVFIIQISGKLIQAANTKVILSNGALAENIFWQVAGNVVIGADAEMQGILLVKTDVLFKTKSSLVGGVLAQTACNLQQATIVGVLPTAPTVAHSATPSAAPSATPSTAPSV
jgi:hypothetical protein